MAVHAEQVDVIADVIEAQYGFGEVRDCAQMPHAFQRRHLKWLVRTKKGKFLAKTYGTEPHTLENLRFQHYLSGHLQNSRVPVAVIQRARSGQTVLDMGDWALEVQQYVSGEPMHITEKTLAIAAKALARFHNVCAGVAAPPRDVNMWRFSEVPRFTYQKMYERACAEHSCHDIAHITNKIAQFMEEAAEELDLDKRRRFEVGLIHGDWHGNNLLFHGEQLLAVIDLEYAGQGCYLEDLAYGISNLCIRTTVEEERLEARTDIFLSEYERGRKLSEYERRALYYAVGVKHITTVAFQFQNADRVAGHGPGDWFNRLLTQTQWLIRRAKEAKNA